MRKMLLILTVCLAACARFENDAGADPRSIHGVNPEFQPYLNLYIAAKGRGLNYEISIGFQDLPNSTVGLCTRWSSGYRQIAIDPSYWNSQFTSENEKVSLIFHELGHCDLNRDHDSTYRPDGWPTSFMFPYNFEYVSSLEDYYFHELFGTQALENYTKLAISCVKDVDTSSE